MPLRQLAWALPVTTPVMESGVPTAALAAGAVFVGGRVGKRGGMCRLPANGPPPDRLLTIDRLLTVHPFALDLRASMAALQFRWWPALAAAWLGLFASADSLRAQPWPELNTDRDAFTPSTRTVDAGRVLTEASYVSIDNWLGKPTSSYPELLCRRGANDWLEWRLGVNYAVGSQGNVVTSVEAGEVDEPGKVAHESSMLYGLKASLREQRGLLPQACFIMEGDTPLHGEHLGTVPIATAVAGWELPVVLPTHGARPWRLDGALRYSYLEGDTGWFSRWGPSAVLRMPVTQRFELHAEWFGTFSEGLPHNTSRPFFSPGGHIVLTKRFEIGLRVGWGLAPDAAPFFSDAGCAWRF